MVKQLFLLLIFSITLANCQNSGNLKVLTDLPSSQKENSGLAIYGDNLWLIEDSGNKDEITQMNLKGEILKDLEVKNAKNKDWEDLAQDNSGNLYIGDFGNNSSDREDLVIYKLPNPEVEPGDKIDAEKIKFSYPNQLEIPSKKKDRHFDAEAFFHWGNSLYIITKNRARPYDGKTFVFKVPDTPGNYKADLVATWNTCNNQQKCSITSATISKDGSKIALISYGYLWLITNFTLDDFTQGDIEKIDLGYNGQLESVVFYDDNTLLLSDERSHGMGGNLYSFSLN
ncbi:hypothetical protein [Flavobacterium sp. ASW18X]|uniref:hypothetical protein n=1 Tax=Flavobacterium sp. ASW18X TaxID=2572595 RepID=UPI0010AE4E97|nr:hypothetical protein [Flavobacterium sp. ASW18X]TKD63622.1 hypothetical protein FBT53_07880 [Flavobacterium sp. ASW18X]